MRKRVIRLLGVVGLGLVLLFSWLLNFHYVTGFDELNGQCDVTHFYADGADMPVFGAEDIEIDYTAGLAFISAFDPAQIAKEVAAGGPVTSQGGLYLWDLRAHPPADGPIPVKDISGSLREGDQFRPHGISMIKRSDGYRFGIVNHAYPMRGGSIAAQTVEDQGEVLLVDYVNGEMSLAARIRNSEMCSPNDLALVDETRFFVSNDHGACEAGAKKTEETLGLAHAYVLYYDGEVMRRVADGIAYANGVSMAPAAHDGRRDLTLYVSATRGERLHMYDGARLMQGDLRAELGAIDLPFSPDNITWDADGNMIVSGFPNLYRFLFHSMGVPGFDATPAAAARIPDPHAERPIIEPLFADNSGMINGATVSARYDGKTIATSVFDNRVLVCDSPGT